MTKDRKTVLEIYELVSTRPLHQTIEEMMDMLDEVQGAIEENYEEEELCTPIA